MRDLKKYAAYRILKENVTESRREWMLYLFAKAGKANSNNTQYQFWQQDNHPVELDFHSDILQQKLDYIHHNPVKAGLVSTASAYIYSSAIDYENGKGVLDITLL